MRYFAIIGKIKSSSLKIPYDIQAIFVITKEKLIKMFQYFQYINSIYTIFF